jgi:uncharacterized membrane protein (GlpM family)
VIFVLEIELDYFMNYYDYLLSINVIYLTIDEMRYELHLGLVIIKWIVRYLMLEIIKY